MRILVVDDDEVNRRVICEMLTWMDAECVPAESGEAGLLMFDQSDYDLVLMDLRMRGTDGLAALRAIRRRSDVKSAIPVVIVTGDAGSDTKAQCEASGATKVLEKPVEMDLLIAVVAELGTCQR